MTIHCFDVIYSPSSSMDSYLSNWLTSWSAWEKEPHDEPSSMTFTSMEAGSTVEASGFNQNRFQWDDTGREPQADAEYIVSNLIGQTGYLASYCDWWIVKWHHCVHDDDTRTVERTRELPDGSTETYEVEVKGCGDWKVLDSSDNYSGQTDVPEVVK